MFNQIQRLKKQKDAAEEKQKQQDEETARVYADFVKSFDVNEDGGRKTFIRAGVMDPNSDVASAFGFSENSKTIYKPQKRGLWLPPSTAKPTETSKPKTSNKSENKREIDSFLEEIKQKQQMQEERKTLHRAQTEATTEEERDKISKQLEELENATKGRGSIPGLVEAEQTTNLYLGNLSPEITEEFLCQQFGKFGVITSVKIMYPRTDEEKSRGRNCGFVSFEMREQAEAAKTALDGADFYGMVVRIGWGKAVARPTATQAPPPAAALSSNPIFDVEEIISQKAVATVDVEVPTNKRTKSIIDCLAKYVAEEGHNFEQYVIEKEANNKDFQFLFDKGTSENIYYRWRVFASAQGDTLKSWRVDPFQIYIGGPMWKPPSEEYFEEPISRISNFSDHPPEGITAASAGPKNKELIRANQTGAQRVTSDDKRQLKELVDSLTKQRQSICETMTFCLDHSDNSFEIAQYLTDSIMQADITIDKMISILYLISDILYNSSSIRQSAWSYRSAFEKYLPDIFEHLFAVKYKVDGRIAMKQLREIIMRILRIWEDWAVYPSQFVKGLEASFLCENAVLDIITSEDINRVLGLPDLVDEELDGTPMEAELFNELIKYPASVRPMVEEWMDMNISQLERLCQRFGLSVKAVSSKAEILKKLANFEAYWKQKEETINRAIAAAAVESSPSINASNGVSNTSELKPPLLSVPPIIHQPNAIESDAMDVDDAGSTPHGVPTITSSIPPNNSHTGAPHKEVETDSSDDIFGEAEDDDDIFKDVSTTKGKTKVKKKDETSAISRKKLRQVELKVMELHVDLEKRGLHPEIILFKCDEMRQALLRDYQRDVAVDITQ